MGEMRFEFNQLFTAGLIHYWNSSQNVVLGTGGRI